MHNGEYFGKGALTQKAPYGSTVNKAKNIVIIGYGGFAKEVRWLIDRINVIEPVWNFLGYVDRIGQGEDVVGDDSFIQNYSQELYVVIAIGDPAKRKQVYDKIKSNKNLVFPNLVDPSAIASDGVSMGEGNVVCAGCVFTVDITVGSFNIFNLNCTIGHDVVIENYIIVEPNCNISGNCHVKSETDIGTGTQVIQGLTIGSKSIIGAGAVVISDIEGNCTAVGVPAKVIKKV